MKRRSFLKTMGLIAGASCVPKGKTMPQIGDLFAKLALGQSLSAAEIEQLRLGMNQQQGITSQMSALLTPSGDLDPNIFSHHSQGFSVLPHASAGMYNSTAQPVAHNVATVMVFEADSSLTADERRFSWAEDMKRSTSTGEFFVQGAPEESLWLFNGIVLWSASPTIAYLYALEKDTATGGIIASGNDTATRGSMIMKARHAATSWQMQVLQTSGGEIDASIVSFSVTRLR